MHSDSENAVNVTVEMEEDDEFCSKEKAIRRSFVQEWKFLEDLVASIVKNGCVVEFSAVKKAQSIMDKYQEQGQLLEPHLNSIVSPLMQIICSNAIELGVDSESTMEIIKPLCIIIYTLVTVCGYKTITKFFPHQVFELELAVSLLERCHKVTVSTSLREESTGEMETQCTMLLWLSILVLIPFDMSSVDTALAETGLSSKDAPPPLAEKMITVCKDYLSNPGPMRKMAGILLSRLLTRPDMRSTLNNFVHWTREALSTSIEETADIFLVPGIAEAMAAIFKVGGRDILLDVAPIVWQYTCNLVKSPAAARSPLLRKLLIKLTQRVGLTYLPQRVPLWRYVGKNSLLGENLSFVAHGKRHHNESMQELKLSLNEESDRRVQEEEMDVPEVIEEIIGQLLEGLRDKDTIVRWSAAKGIGRITGRLTVTLADEVLASILELFSPGEGDGSWHGGCLALAELARRGLLLPVRLPEVVPVIIKALHYDVRRGPHSVGYHVRDAAAYVCWAFGRAYSHSVMRGILEQLAPHLLTIACYDREVNCRRAAAAAFQENVGRQGSFPHGIDIVNAADYFSLSSRVNSYRQVAVNIAQFKEYLFPFVEELLQYKIRHWDKALRELAAVALASLVKYDVAYFGDTILDKLIPWTLSTDLNLRHGATLSIAEVILALHQCNHVLSLDKQKAVAGIVPAIEKGRLYRGKGGEIMRASVSRLIECASIAYISLSPKTQKSLLDTLNENLKHPNAQIQAYAVEALKHFVRSYMISADASVVKDITSKYLQLLSSDPNPAAKRGSALALSVLPREFLTSDWRTILKTLCAACLLRENPYDQDAETRVNAVRGLATVCESLTGAGVDSIFSDVPGEELPLAVIKNQVMECLFKALDDYSVDNRGDVGSWVREAAMEGLERCTYILCKSQAMFPGKGIQTIQPVKHLSGLCESSVNSTHESNLLFDANLAARLIGGIAKQAVEKIDKVRETAGRTLQRIIHNENIFVPHIPHRGELERIIPNDATLNWAVPSNSYPRLVCLLQFSEYRIFLLSGLVISLGGLADSLRKASLSALLEYLKVSEGREPEISKEKATRLITDFLLILQSCRKNDRIIIPTLKTIEILFNKGVFSTLEECEQSFAMGLLESLTIELKGSKDVTKLVTGINVLEHISAMPEPISCQALSRLYSFLCHPYPKVRKACADQLYLFLIQNGEQRLDDDRMNAALELIGETCWEGPIEEAESERKKLLDILHLENPVVAEFASHKSDRQILMQKKGNSDENQSYSSLVGSSGF